SRCRRSYSARPKPAPRGGATWRSWNESGPSSPESHSARNSQVLVPAGENSQETGTPVWQYPKDLLQFGGLLSAGRKSHGSLFCGAAKARLGLSRGNRYCRFADLLSRVSTAYLGVALNP